MFVSLSGGIASVTQIVFPYTASVSVGSTVTYADYDLVHTNYSINAFQKSRPNNIKITAPIYNQDKSEIEITSNILLFLAANSKMNFGANGTGAPPPVLNFVGPNKFAGSSVPVVIAAYDVNYPNEPDYVTADGQNYFPTEMTINIDLIPQYSADLQNSFDLNTFASGEAYGQGFI